MKRLALALALALGVQGAFAMVPPRGGFGGGHYYPRSTVVLGGGFYNPYFSPFGFYYGYPYPYAAAPYQPTKLDMEINDIKNEYADKIESVRMDNSLTGRERRSEVRDFRRERDQAVLDARRNYYKEATQPQVQQPVQQQNAQSQAQNQ